MSAEKKEESISAAEIAAKKELAVKREMECRRRTANHTKRSFFEAQNALQRSQLQMREKRQKWPQTHPRSFMSPPERVAVSADSISSPKPSVSASDQASLNGQKTFCEVCKVECSCPLNYKQHISGKKHKAKLIEVAEGGKKGDSKNPKCELCGISCTDESSLRMHINGRKHRMKVHRVKVLDSQVLYQNKIDA